MIYLVGLFLWWLRDVLLPTALVGGTAALVWLLLGRTLWRTRPRLRRRGLLVLGVAAVAWLAIGTRQVLFRFENAQFDMFRTWVADPIPAAVEDLAVAGAAPAMFHDGALLRFRAPGAVRGALLTHALPGSAVPQLAARIAERNGRNPRVTGRICTYTGGYVPYDPQTFSGYDKPEWAPVIDRLRRGEPPTLPDTPADHDLFVYAERGDWGTLVCLVRIEGDVVQLTITPLPNAPR